MDCIEDKLCCFCDIIYFNYLGFLCDEEFRKTIHCLARTTTETMFEEVISLAVISSFVLNIFYVAHPNTVSYTLGFLLSLATMAPFILVWKYLARARAIRAAREAHEDAVDLVLLGVSEVLGGIVVEMPMADLEKGLGDSGTEVMGT